MSFTWTDDIATGVNDIDKQHQELFTRMNGLLAACNEGRSRKEIGSYLDFLCEYIDFHFSAEEREMADRGYPDLPTHRAQHGQFTKQVSDLHHQFSVQGASIQVVLATITTSGAWLVNHIQRTDKKMATFLKRKAG